MPSEGSKKLTNLAENFEQEKERGALSRLERWRKIK